MNPREKVYDEAHSNVAILSRLKGRDLIREFSARGDEGRGDWQPIIYYRNVYERALVSALDNETMAPRRFTGG